MFLVISLLWGANFLLMKKAALAFSPSTIAAGRLAGAWLFFLTVALLRRPRRPWRWPFTAEQTPAWLTVMLVGFIFPFALFPFLIRKYADSGFFGMMVAFVPLMTIVLSIPMLGVLPRRRELVGVLLGLAALGMLAGEGVARGVSFADFLLALSIPFAFALVNTTIKRSLSRLSPIDLALVVMGGALCAMIPWSFFNQPPIRDKPWPVALAALIWLGVIGTGAATHMFWTLIQKRGPLFAGMVSYLIPVVAVVFGWIDREPIGLWQLLALLGILAAIALVQWPQPQKQTGPI